MTSSTATNRRRRGFTLIELMVTMGIIIVLIAILLPVLLRARKTAMRTRMQADLHGLSQALDAYRADFRDYPRVDYSAANPITMLNPQCDRIGAITLCWAILAPGPASNNTTVTPNIGGDGADGPGFRVRGTQGQVYGPYIQPGKYNVTGNSDWDSTINDVNGNPYLYFPAFTGADIHNITTNPPPSGGYANAYVPSGSSSLSSVPLPQMNMANPQYIPKTTTSISARPMYNFVENAIVINTNDSHSIFTLEQMQIALGDTGPTQPVQPGGPNGFIDGTETPATTGPYLLWGAGPDDAFGPPYNATTNTYGTSDDVTNFN